MSGSGDAGFCVMEGERGSWGEKTGTAHGVASSWDAMVSSMLASPPINGGASKCLCEHTNELS